MAGQKLTPTVSLSNSTEQGLFSLSVSYKGLFDSVEYYQNVGNAAEMNKESTFVRFMNGSLDGHLGVYEWEEFDRFGWNEVADLFKEEIDECSYPTVCGKFGICSKGQKCRCPEPTIQGTTNFKQVIEKQPEIGNCSCKAVVFRYHSDPAVGAKRSTCSSSGNEERRTGQNIRIQHWILLRSTFLNWNFGAASSKKRKCR
ncbi:hypothetical protein D5086_023805 [Populus alba]|uniref:Uncharacterized protein n=1 Tax=Populus alba TaxID=43335 RepID=A0ACC4BBA8_POPAL